MTDKREMVVMVDKYVSIRHPAYIIPQLAVIVQRLVDFPCDDLAEHLASSGLVIPAH